MKRYRTFKEAKLIFTIFNAKPNESKSSSKKLCAVKEINNTDTNDYTLAISQIYAREKQAAAREVSVQVFPFWVGVKVSA